MDPTARNFTLAQARREPIRHYVARRQTDETPEAIENTLGGRAERPEMGEETRPRSPRLECHLVCQWAISTVNGSPEGICL